MTKQTGIASREVLITNAGGDIPLATIESIRNKKFSVRVCQDIDQLKTALTSIQDPILIIEAGTDPAAVEEVARNIVVEFGSMKLPVIFIGEQASRFESVLEKTFPASATLDSPYGTAEVLAAINYLFETYQQRKAKIISGAIKRSLGVEKDHKPQKFQRPAGPIHKEYETAEGIPELVFEQLKKLDIFNQKLGGAAYSGVNIDEGYLQNTKMLPANPALVGEVRSLCIDAGRWGRLHLARTSYIAQRILDPMDPTPELREDVKTAAFLFCSSFAGNSIELLKRPLFDARAANARQELGKQIGESATAIQKKLKNDGVSRLIAKLSQLVMKEVIPENDDLSITASALMAADFTDRVCFQTGSFNPRRTYVYLNRLKQGHVTEFHPSVLACLVKFLAEALAGNTRVIMLPKTIRFDKRLLADLKKEAKAAAPIGEEKIPVSELTPGMRLSQPLVALDGKEILSEDLVLDEDLIWRVGQLSAIRPLKSAVIFK